MTTSLKVKSQQKGNKMLNKAMIIGRLGQDPELKQLPTGGSICSFTIATSRKTKDGQQITQWHNIAAFGKTADNSAQYLKKGSTAYVEGELDYQQWTDKQTGHVRNRTVIKANQVLFLDPREQAGLVQREQQPMQNNQLNQGQQRNNFNGNGQQSMMNKMQGMNQANLRSNQNWTTDDIPF